MAPIVIEDLNVFTFAHSRMRKLMNCCTSKVGHTDFTSLNDFEELLIRLERTFIEFQAHEEIENKYVMKKLKYKIKEDQTMTNTELVCNCHKIDRFTPLISLFRDGYAFIRRGNADRLSYGIKLHKAMCHFNEDFVPHMIEEENDIQPLLSKYFSEIELKIMRIEVNKMTLRKRKNSELNLIYQIERPLQIYIISSEYFPSMNLFSNEILENIFKYLTTKQLKQSCLTINKQWYQCTLKVVEKRSPISKLPDEILLKIFTYYLNPFDLFHSCIRVNRQWKNIISERKIWKIVNPINWSRKQWNTNMPLENHSSFQQETHEINEIRILNGFTNQFLPNFGRAIENLILYGSLTINDNLARKILNYCPNLKHLNIGMTKLTAKTFLQYRWITNLESLIVEGCELMDDNLFVNILNSLFLKTDENLIENLCCQTNQFDCLSSICQKCSSFYSKNVKNQCQLKILNISGCYRLTDYSLNLLISNELTSNLIYIDLSGCIGLTVDLICSLISSSKYLSTDNLYICDNIQLSTSLSTVNCCRNFENNSGRFCCRLIH